MKRVIASILIICMPFMCSCSLFATSTQPITIIPSHENGEVYVDGNLKGKGVQTVFLHKRRSHSIMAKCGGSAGTGSVTRHLSTTGILDIIGGVLFLAPFLGRGRATIDPESTPKRPHVYFDRKATGC